MIEVFALPETRIVLKRMLSYRISPGVFAWHEMKCSRCFPAKLLWQTVLCMVFDLVMPPKPHCCKIFTRI
jgi:hypothetical protein